MVLLNHQQIISELLKLPEWSYLDNSIVKEFQFKDFTEALAFVNKAGSLAEEMNHHPDIFIHSWNKVKLTISTHSEGGVTNKDLQLAEKIESIRLK
jgi:4a-hydroxytetrahydrobiopterin dehydratase